MAGPLEDRVYGKHVYRGKELLLSFGYSYAVPKASPLKVIDYPSNLVFAPKGARNVDNDNFGKFQRDFQLAIAWCRDMGIFDYEFEYRMPNQAQMSAYSLEDLVAEPSMRGQSEGAENVDKPLTIAHILPFIAIYGVGIALSTIAFMVEKVANICMTQKKEKRSSKVSLSKNESVLTEIAI